MTVCVPIKDLKNTATFSKLVESSPDPVIVTRKGRESFAVMTVEELDALRLEAARAQLYRDIDEAEDDFAHGRMSPGCTSNRSQMRKMVSYGKSSSHRYSD